LKTVFSYYSLQRICKHDNFNINKRCQMSIKFKDRDNNDVLLKFKEENDFADATHVLTIPIYTNKLLFTQHKKRGIEFPGGKVEVNETSQEAAIRELHEET